MTENEHYDKVLPCSCHNAKLDTLHGGHNREFIQVWNKDPYGYEFECNNCHKRKMGWVNDKRWVY